MAGGLIAGVVMALVSILPAVASSPAPIPALAVEVLYGPSGGPDRFRSDFQDELLRELRSRGCYPTVIVSGDGGELLFRVSLEAPLEEQHNTLSLAGSMRNENEMGSSTTTSTIRIHADMEILLPGTRELFRGKRIRSEASYRPTFAWEDGSAEARDELLRGFADQVAGFACKANGKKLRKRLVENNMNASAVR